MDGWKRLKDRWRRGRGSRGPGHPSGVGIGIWVGSLKRFT